MQLRLLNVAMNVVKKNSVLDIIVLYNSIRVDTIAVHPDIVIQEKKIHCVDP
tara:strand:- start:1237 stop:1392 length:156 start_codon:yes stop_codon:yes gene_type:complete